MIDAHQDNNLRYESIKTIRILIKLRECVAQVDDKCLCLASESLHRARNTKRERRSARLHVVDILHSRAIVTRSASVSQRIGFHLAFRSRLSVKIEDKNRDRFVV